MAKPYDDVPLEQCHFPRGCLTEDELDAEIRQARAEGDEEGAQLVERALASMRSAHPN